MQSSNAMILQFNRDTILSEFYTEETRLQAYTIFHDPIMKASIAYWNIVKNKSTLALCGICYTSTPDSELINKCPNTGPYCKECTRTFLTSEIREARVHENGCECLCRNCNAYFSENDIRSLVAYELFEKFIQFRNAKMILLNPLNVYCPYRHCDAVVTISKGASRAKCKKCKTSFCCKCNSTHNMFVTCEWVSYCDLMLICWLIIVCIFLNVRLQVRTFENGKAKLKVGANDALAVLCLLKKMVAAAIWLVTNVDINFAGNACHLGSVDALQGKCANCSWSFAVRNGVQFQSFGRQLKL